MWNSEQVISLAPDAASVKAGRGLAQAAKWSNLGLSAGDQPQALWGACQGSGSKPYQTWVDFQGPAFKCSCPSQKFPCKHALGMLLLYAQTPTLFPNAEPPAAVQKWLDKRQAKAEAAPAKKAASTKAKALKPTAARMAKMQAGLAELEVWLYDVARMGFEALKADNSRPLERMAVRLVDAQLPALARELRLVNLYHEGALAKLLRAMARMQYSISAFAQLDKLPEPQQVDVFTLLGVPLTSAQVLAQPAVAGSWWILGQVIHKDHLDERILVRRVWLWSTDGQPAMILEFSAPQQGFQKIWPLETCLKGDLYFYPSAYPQRALLPEYTVDTSAALPVGCSSVREALQAYQQALSLNPHLERFPMLLERVHIGEGQIRDAEGGILTLTPNYLLYALATDQLVKVFGIWEAGSFHALTVWTAEGDPL